jgi:23S rRNA (cytidine1920-2'-O)/16S rRNA (cytidine1409-2'-O)-methyltransferase
MLRKAVREFATKKIAPNADEWDKTHYFPYEEVIKPMGELGFFGTVIPEEPFHLDAYNAFSGRASDAQAIGSFSTWQIGRDRNLSHARRWDGDILEVIAPPHPYVSRGGAKLQGALDEFGYDPNNSIALDVGASTGGFTDCLLSRGAQKVYALDVGYGQLAWNLRSDPRVVPMERTNIRHTTPESFPDPINLAVVDVSFISLSLVLPSIHKILIPGGCAIALIKPQFEVGRNDVGKGGVVKDPAKHKRAVDSVSTAAQNSGFVVKNTCTSPLKGPKGNTEFFIHLHKPSENINA